MAHESKPVSKFRAYLTFLLGLSAALAQSGCEGKPRGGQAELQTSAERSEGKTPDGTLLHLTLTGYNYSNRYIDQFSVNGNGGGNLFVSGPTSGGGGSICCVRRVKGATRPVKVRWQSSACMYSEKASSGSEVFSRIHNYFTEAQVEVTFDNSDHPKYFEVHFYPDGHVEAAMTKEASNPRLVLSKQREDRSSFPRCPNDKNPEQ
jgi:hypothetical protein